MKIIPEVQCRRCGATFSSLRSRCPSCGTRRVTQSGRTPGTTPGTVQGTAAYERAETNTKWQLVFGMILVVAVILAVIVMVSTSLDGADKGIIGNKPAVTSPTPSSQGVPIVEAPPTTPPTPTPSEAAEPRFCEEVVDRETGELCGGRLHPEVQEDGVWWFCERCRTGVKDSGSGCEYSQPSKPAA